MGERIGLDKGAQTLAASHLAGAAAEVRVVLDVLSNAFGEHGSGFVGAGAGALAQGVSGWFAAASGLPGTLAGYGVNLLIVDASSAAADAAGAGALSGAAEGGGPVMPSGLDLGPR